MDLPHCLQLKPPNPSTNNLHSIPSVCDPYYTHLTNPKFSQDGALPDGTIFSTKPIVAQFRVQENLYPSFQMHYQTIEVELSITM